ncbi:MAG TPA: YHS domain-containing (seleno)protein [Verrucomicrobiae bacterium]|nr:YHS domain-containing (seleno)protein [Verrucomicrobiae bacterium]
MKKPVLSVMAGFAVLVSGQAAEVGGKSLVLKNNQGLAIQGYDPVAYFTDNKPVKGNAKFSSEYEGAKYHFASAEHKELFDGNPAKYAPAYGGFCGYAASVGKVRPANPLIWSIVHGQLILQHTKGADQLWKKDVAGNKAKADKYWPYLIAAKAGKKDPTDSLLGKSVLDLAKIAQATPGR